MPRFLPGMLPLFIGIQGAGSLPPLPVPEDVPLPPVSQVNDVRFIHSGLPPRLQPPVAWPGISPYELGMMLRVHIARSDLSTQMIELRVPEDDQ